MFARSFGWLRRHPQLVDLLWALPLLTLALNARFTSMVASPRGHVRLAPWPVHVLLVVLLCVPMIWRRRHPRTVFAVVALVSFGQWLADVNPGVANIAVLIGMYTVVARCAVRWALAAALVTELGAVLAFVDSWRVGPRPANWRTMWPGLITISVFVCAIVVWALYVRIRLKYTQSLEERAERLERERDAQARAAAAAERARIAREMHDVIAHGVSVMVVQADGAAYMVDLAPERARRALETIGATGRQALTEMRRMLGVLREGGEVRPYAPQPGVGQLAELVGQARSAGLSVDLAIEGVPAELPAAMQLTIYRIVQEALTNTRKHAGPAAAARVRLRYRDDAVEIGVHDDGRGAAAANDGRGHGLVGMGERAALFGGTLRTGPRPGGGYEVVASLPVPDARQAEATTA